MAKQTSSEKYAKATINYADDTITEYLKDVTNVYSIKELLTRWDGVDNINISLSTDDEIPSAE